MTVTRIAKIPSELPFAHLYLDDVEEICQILSHASGQVGPHERPLAVSFSVGDDLLMDSIEDLQQRGGSSTNFTIRVGSNSIHIRGFLLNPTIYCYGLDESEQLAVYHKLKVIFDARRMTLRNDLSSLPGWVSSLIYFVFAIGIFSLLNFLNAGFRTYVGYIAFLLGVIALIFIRPSRVSFVRSHERFKELSSIKRGYVRDILMMITGGVVGKLIEYCAHRWLKL